MFEHLLSSIGIGGATVDTKLRNSHFHIGDPIEGAVHIEGDNSNINKITLKLIERIKNNDSTSEFESLDQVLDEVTLNADGPFTPFTINDYTIQSKTNSIVLETRLYLHNAVDAYDEDEIVFD